MIKLFQKILSLIMSIFMSVNISASVIETENNMIYYDPDIDPGIIYEQQMLDYWNQIPSDEFGGYYINDGTEIVIRGFRAESYDANGYDGYEFFNKNYNIRIPDEIDGIPVTTIAESAFEWGFAGTIATDIKPHTIVLGNNIKTIEYLGVVDIPNVIAGKNVSPFHLNDELMYIDEEQPNFGWKMGQKLFCYKDSEIYNFSIKQNYENAEIFIIDESHLLSTVATIDEELNVRGLPSGLTKETVKDYVSVDGDAIMEISDDVITTGTTIELINREYGLIDNTYTVIVDGDINGDGLTGETEDFSAMRDIITGSDSEYSDINKKAADLNGDGIVNSTDLTIMKSLLN